MSTTTAKGRQAALTLYRSILRAHKSHLPSEMRMLGDAYVKSEFKLHKAVTNDAQLDQFFTAWEEYLGHISQTSRRNAWASSAGGGNEGGENGEDSALQTGFGQNLPSEVDLTDEQISQLEKLREETAKAGKPSL